MTSFHIGSLVSRPLRSEASSSLSDTVRYSDIRALDLTWCHVCHSHCNQEYCCIWQRYEEGKLLLIGVKYL